MVYYAGDIEFFRVRRKGRKLLQADRVFFWIMFESDDWTFEDAFDDIEEETRRKSHSPCQNEEQTPSVKRRKVDSCEALSSLPTNSSFVQKLQVDTIAYIEDNNPSSSNKNDVSREDLLLGIFQKDTSRETFDFAKEVEKDPSSVQREMQCHQSKIDATSEVFQYKKSRGKSHGSATEVTLGKDVKLIRIFPGPAGLVPHVPSQKNDHVSAASYLSSVKELENKTATKRIEIKSQDEKNLVEERAWKFLLKDLPNNFLQDYGISTVKEKANASHCVSTKVRFIAGVLDYIDHSHDDPFVIIKDSTGSLEGTIHRDIPLTYPGILEPNVVIFLHDVGLLKTTTYVVTNKYHILVSLVNLLAIYSDKGRIVSTSLMESTLSHTSNIELNRNNYVAVSKPVFISGLQKINESLDTPLKTSTSIDTSTKDHESELAKDPLLYSTNGKNENYGEAFKKNDKNYKVTDKILQHLNYSMDMDDLNMDDFFTTDCDFTTLEEQNCLDRSLFKSISQTSKIQQCNLQVQNTKHSENTKKESTINFQKQIKEQHLPETLEKCVTDIKTCFSSYDTVCRDSNLNVKSTLPAIKRNVDNSKTLVSYFINDKNDEYDSDDEILSQLDVDNVFHKAKTDCQEEARISANTSM